VTRRRIDASLRGFELPTLRHHWTDRDVILYALAVGATAGELDLIYEGRGPHVLPTFAAIPSSHFLPAFLDAVDFDIADLLHGEQSIVVHRPIPPTASVDTTRRCIDVWDKGAAAIVVWESVTADSSGPLFTSTGASFIRGAGGFGGERGPSGARHVPPERPPDHVVTVETLPTQAALYRLTGDRNPLHVDPAAARAAGYDRPFLHGLATYGITGLALTRTLCDGIPERIVALESRFAGIVFPGATLTLHIWQTAPGEAVLTAHTPHGPALTATHVRFRL
jgi:acyl dehydratase